MISCPLSRGSPGLAMPPNSGLYHARKAAFTSRGGTALPPAVLEPSHAQARRDGERERHAARLFDGRGRRRGQACRQASPGKHAQPLAAAPAEARAYAFAWRRRPGGRAVTLVLGLAGSEAQIAALAKELKSVCGAGGTVKDGIIELQGDHRDSAQAALAERGLKVAHLTGRT